jgi:large subunit ribosomal protein L29
MKAEEVHQISDEELAEELKRLRQHLYDLKSQAVTEKVEDPSQFRKTRRDIARLLTERRERQLAAEQAEAKA